jgi:8-amino-7-oxononanoate synthase
MVQLSSYKKIKRKIKAIIRKTKYDTKKKLKNLSKPQEPQPSSVSTMSLSQNHDLFKKCKNFTQADEVKAAGLYPYFRVIESGQDVEVTVNGKRMIMIGSNNYLGLTNDPRVKEAAIEAVKKYGSGCTGSRFLNGTLSIHVELEEKLASFLNKEACLVYSTGFQTNLGVISALVGKDEVIFTDRSDHASIVDGCRLSFGKTIKFRHNDMEDLERLLIRYKDAKGKLIVVDGVYSMEGDLAPLPQIVSLAKKYNARVMVDDAHAVGVFGKNGRGTPEHFNVEKDVDLIMFTFSKSFASIGGMIAGDEYVINYLKHFSRELIFSASLPPASVATVLKTLEIIQNEPFRRERLWKITRKMMEGYKSLGFNIGTTQSPIIPIYIGDDMLTFKMAKMLADEGVFVNPIVSPAVPPGQALIRTSYTATHTDEQMDFVLEKFKKVGRALGII